MRLSKRICKEHERMWTKEGRIGSGEESHFARAVMHVQAAHSRPRHRITRTPPGCSQSIDELPSQANQDREAAAKLDELFFSVALVGAPGSGSFGMAAMNSREEPDRVAMQ